MTKQMNHDRIDIHLFPLEQRRRIQAAVLNGDLCKWLQSKGAARGGRQRIERLIESCISLAQLASPESLATVEECQPFADTINHLLRRYKATQKVVVDSPVDVCWIPDCPKRSDADSEFTIVEHMMRLLQNGELAKLRKCECGSYFFARSSIVRFCSEKCRTAYWENSEMRKEQKRKKAKEYYRLHKTKNIK